MLRWFVRCHDAIRRQFDLVILWPACKKAVDLAIEEQGLTISDDEALERAKGAFAVHCFNDGPWQRLGERRINEIIEELT